MLRTAQAKCQLAPAAGRVHQHHSPQHQRARRTAPQRHAHPIQDDHGHVSNQALLDAPWSTPSWRCAWVSNQPTHIQALTVFGVTVLGAALTYCSYHYWGPWFAARGKILANYRHWAPSILAGWHAFMGALHLSRKEHNNFACIYPHQGAWGFWYLPGSPSLHVRWTGVANILGGLGVIIGALNPPSIPHWLLKRAAALLLFVTVVSTPANIYSWTHNAARLPEEKIDEMPGGAIPIWWHLARGAFQVLLLATWLAVARFGAKY